MFVVWSSYFELFLQELWRNLSIFYNTQLCVNDFHLKSHFVSEGDSVW
jgi:hypothetical protein